MNKIKLNHIINILIVAWVFIWFYFLILNWDVFIVELDTNLGFTVIGGYPFLFFSLVGLLFLILIKYINLTIEIKRINIEKDMINKIALLEKDIELLRSKESLFAKQSEEVNLKTADMNVLYEKLTDLISDLKQERSKGINQLPGESTSYRKTSSEEK